MNAPLHIVADIVGTNACFAGRNADADTRPGIALFARAEFSFVADALST